MGVNTDPTTNTATEQATESEPTTFTVTIDTDLLRAAAVCTMSPKGPGYQSYKPILSGVLVTFNTDTGDAHLYVATDQYRIVAIIDTRKPASADAEDQLRVGMLGTFAQDRSVLFPAEVIAAIGKMPGNAYGSAPTYVTVVEDDAGHRAWTIRHGNSTVTIATDQPGAYPHWQRLLAGVPEWPASMAGYGYNPDYLASWATVIKQAEKSERGTSSTVLRLDGPQGARPSAPMMVRALAGRFLLIGAQMPCRMAT